jgi:hypothetical protein
MPSHSAIKKFNFDPPAEYYELLTSQLHLIRLGPTVTF